MSDFVSGPSVKEKKVEVVGFFCPKHGRIERPLTITYSDTDSGETTRHEHVYCPACFAALLDWAQDEGIMKRISKRIITN